MATSVIKKQLSVLEYSGRGETNAYGNLAIPVQVVTPSTGVVIGVTNEGNYKAIIMASSAGNQWILRFFNYATTNMNSVINTSVSYKIFYLLK